MKKIKITDDALTMSNLLALDFQICRGPLRRLLGCILAGVLISMAPKAQAETSACGYSSFSDLMLEASKAIETIRAATQFKPTFWADNQDAALEKLQEESIISKNQAIVASRSMFESQIPWVREVLQDVDRIRNTENMRVFKEKGIAHLILTNDNSECDSLGCANYSDFTIQVNIKLANQLFLNHEKSLARKYLLAVIGHEYGHFIVSYYYIASGKYRSATEAFKNENPLVSHLTVDAISMLLTSTSKEVFMDMLRIASMEKVLESDIPQRLECLEKLK